MLKHVLRNSLNNQVRLILACDSGLLLGHLGRACVDISVLNLFCFLASMLALKLCYLSQYICLNHFCFNTVRPSCDHICLFVSGWSCALCVFTIRLPSCRCFLTQLNAVPSRGRQCILYWNVEKNNQSVTQQSLAHSSFSQVGELCVCHRAAPGQPQSSPVDSLIPVLVTHSPLSLRNVSH